jgi:predicted Zn-dependent protease
MRFGSVFLTLVALCGCTVNPVTGERNFQVYGTDWEREVGAQMYAPMKQSQGGEFILDPELDAYVSQVGNRLAARSRRQGELDYEFSILNDSVPNAWALPGGKISINRGLLAALDSEAELAAVLGHEIVHADASHGARAQSKAMLTQAGAVISMVVLGSTLSSDSAREVAMMVPALGAQLITQKYGRDAEREADEYGMLYLSEAGYDPQGAVQLQETFVELSEGRQQDWLSGLFASHPPSPERVENNRATAAGLPPGGEMGAEEFQRRTAYLRRVQPAYEAFDEASEAVSEERLDDAQERLDEAMALEPRESLFHALQGDIHALNKKPERALASYEKAIQAHPELFYGHLRSGQVAYRLDRHEQARSSLHRSLELLPTAEAHYLLGMLDREAGDLDSALSHFRAAADSQSPAGQQAARELVVLDLPANPSKYIAARAALDRQNVVWVQFGNLTSVAVRDIEISYAWLDEQGQTRQGMRTYAGPLGAGEQAQLSLGIRLGAPAELDRRVRVQVTAARPAE